MGGAFNKPGLVLRQLAPNGVVAGSYVDVLGADNPSHTAASK